MSIARETVADANTEAVGSMNSQLDVYNQSIQASLDKFHVAFQELSTDLINSDFIKGAVDAGTTIIKIIDELVKHIGVLGTTLTGLGIAKIFTTAVNGAKSVEGLVPAVSLLSEALSTGAGKGEAFGLVLEQLGAKAAGAGSAIGTMLSSLGGFIASPAGLVTGAVAAVVAAGAIAYNIRKKQQEELRKQATATTEKWGDDKSSVDDFKRQYTELNDQLKNVNLTESERIGIKQQLLDLQNQISKKYGADAGQLDLINGKYETQLGLISQITEKEAHRNLQNNREAYQQSIDEMTKDRTYTLFSNGSGSDLMKKIEMAYVQNGFKDQGDLSFDFTGDVTEADKNIRALMDRLEQLKATANDTEKQFIDSVIGATSKLLAKNNEILDANQANYQAYLEQSLYDDGYGDELAKYSKLVKEYNEALAGDDVAVAYKKRSEMLAYYRDNIESTFEGTQYEDFFTNVTDQIDTASQKMMDWQDIVDDETTYATNGLAKYTDIIRKTVGDIKKLKLDGVDIQAILGDPSSAMYKDMAQLARLWNSDINLGNPDDLQLFSDFLMKVVYGADAFTDGVDLAKSSFDDFMKSASASIDTLDKVNAALVNGFKSGGLSARIDAETGKLTGDVKTIMDAYKVADASDIFERTADGIIVNRDALRELQAEQEKTIKDEFVDRIAEAQENYNNAINSGDTTAISYWKEQLDNVQLLAAAYDGATSAYQKWVEAQKGGEAGDQYDQVVSTALKRGKELYDKGLVGTNEFRAIAQLYSNEDLSTASIDEITKAYEDGATTVKKYFTEGQDGAVAFADKMVELGYATKDANDEYDFYDGIDTQKVADDLGISVDLIESAFKKLSDYGFDIHFNFGDASIEDIRTQLKAWSEGGDVDLNVRPVIDTDLLKAAGWEDAGEGAATLFTSTFSNEAGDIAMNFTPIMTDENGNFKGVLSPSELTEYAEGVIAGVREDDLHLKIGATFEGEDAIHQAGEVAEKMHEAHEELLVRGEFVFDDGELQYALDTATALRNRIDYLNNLKATTGVDVDIENDEEVRELSDNLLSVDDKEIRAKFGIDGISDVDSVIQKYENGFEIPANITADESGVQTPTDTSATVNYSTGSVEGVGAQTAVLNYTTGAIEPVQPQTTALDYTTGKIEQVPDQSASINYSNGTIEQVPDQYATINYSANVTGLSALPDDGERRTIYLDTYTVEHYKGTVSRSAFQNLGSTGKVTGGSSHANGTLGKVGLKNDESALINELGAEIVVRPSDDSWMIFNDGKPTFANLKRGDVIFNADLTRQLLEKGEADDYARILSGNSHASGTLKGKAHATVKGGGSFKKATSSSKKSSGGGGGNDGGGSSNSKDDAEDFNEILDEIQINIDRIERDIKNLDTIASDTFTNLTGRTSALNKELAKVRKEIKVQQIGYNRYLAKANSVGLNGTWAARVRAGENLTIDDVTDEDLWDKIEEYRKWYELALDCRDAIYQLKVNEGELWQQRFDVRQTDFENQIEQIQHVYELLDSFIEKAENTGRITSNTLRLRQLDQERSKVTKLQEEYRALEGVIAEALRSGEITKNSEGYYNMLNTLNDIRESIAESTSNIEKLNKEIRETEWEIFDRALEKIENINDELEFLYGILGDEENFYDKNGRVTNEGISAFGVLSAQYNVAMQEAQKYADEIRKINEDIANDPYNQDLIERREELRKSQRDAIEDAEKYKDSIVDLVENGIKSQIDAIKELIDQYTDLLDAEKDEHDYAERVASAQENINKLQKQLNAYSNDDTEEGMARRQKLVSDLRNARENLAETEEDRRISQTKKLLSDLQEEYEDILNARLDNIDNLIEAVINGVDANSSIIKEAITTAANDVGYLLSESASTIFDNASDTKDLASYFTNGDFVEKVTTIADAVQNIDNYIQNAIKNADQTQSGNISKEDSTISSTESIMNSAAQTGTRVRNNTNKISGLDGNWGKNGKNWEWTFNNGEKATGWSLIDNKWYSFENNGRMRANEWFQDSNGRFYHLGASGAMDRNKWITKGNTWSFVGSGGAASTGWQYLPWSGGKDWFYFNSNGDMLKGMQNIGGRNYYMDTRTGAMAKNKWVKSGGKWYYMDKTGAASTGWRQLDWSGGKNWFYFNGNGEMLTGMQNVGGNMYYMDGKTGAMAKNQWIKSNGKWYYMGESGAAAKGWNYLKSGSGQNWYYFNPDGTMKASEWYYDPKYGAWYWFTESGAMARDGKFKTIDGEKWFDASGKWRGYKSGTRAVGSDGLYWTNEGMPETIVRKSDGAILTRLNSGDTVFNSDATKTMWDFANNPAKFLRGMGVSNTYGSGNNVNLEFNLSGLRSPTEFMNALRKDKRFEQFIQEITIGRVNGHGTLAKNAIKF